MKIKGLAPMPTIRQLADGTRWVFPECCAHLGGRALERQQSLALAGPFPDRFAAARWIVEHCEARLAPPQLAVWAECLERAGGVAADPFHLIGLLMFLLERAPRERVLRCAGPALQRTDHDAGVASPSADP